MSDPDLTGKICVVTGASRGIGTVTARRLAEMGATVAMVGRDAAALKSAAESVRRASSPDLVSTHVADFASLDEVRGLGLKLTLAYPRIDVLVNNAGLWLNKRELSVDGYEKTLAVNHLAPFLLTHLLLDALQAGGGGARIVNVASTAHRGGRINLADLMLEKSYNGTGAYARTKLANVLFTRELARRLDPAAVTVNALHPGAVRTDLGRDPGLSRVLYILGALVMIGPERGARTQVYLASSPEVGGKTGGYYSRSKLRAPAPLARDDALATLLWDESARLTGL